MKTHILMINGKQGSGKTTLANNIIKLLIQPNQKGWAFASMTFAQPLYEIHNFARNILRKQDFQPPSGLEIKDGPFLQWLGTEWGRKTYGENVWCEYLKREMVDERFIKKTWAKNFLIIVSDLRFRNEFDYFPEAMRIRLECPKEVRKLRCEQWRENDTHQSEIDLDEYFKLGKFDRWYDSEKLSSEEIARFVLRDIIAKSENKPQAEVHL